MMWKVLGVGLVLVIAVALAFDSVFVVDESQRAIVTEFGAPVGGVREAGLHFKIPMTQQVRRFDRRILMWDGDPNQIPTKDKRYIWVDTTARWRIEDPLKFYTTVATEQGALSRLDDILDSVVRDAVSGHLLVELVRGKDYKAPDGTEEVMDFDGREIIPENLVGREEIMAAIQVEARKAMPEYGIELVDIQIKRINYVEQVLLRVYERMISERKKVASQFRSEGEGEKANILGQMQKELKRISSDAYRESVQIRGEADAEAARIYAEAFSKDPDFYGFVRTLESYRKAIQANTRLVVSTDSDFYRYLQRVK
jgi:membrane protease subunit HflC